MTDAPRTEPARESAPASAGVPVAGLGGPMRLLVRAVVGLALITVVIGVVAAWWSKHFEASVAAKKHERVREDFELIRGALDAYAAAHGGKYPEALGALWVPDEKGFSYLPSQSPPKDPWGNGYRYEPPKPGEKVLHVWTLGIDKRDGGDGESTDIRSWEESH